MIRRLNYTGRLRILREDARFMVTEQPDRSPSFRAALDLTGYGLPDDARVYVEAYRQTVWMRFSLGTVGTLVQPDDTDLAEFDSPEGILFRVRVTSVDGTSGKLLAEVDGIRSRRRDDVETDVEPLLPVRPDELGTQVWVLDAEDRPHLVINKEVGDWKTLALSPGFASLVYPAVLREILDIILIKEKSFDIDDQHDWRHRWLRFATLIPGVPEVPDPKAERHKVEEWISDAVMAFCRSQKILDRFLTFWRAEDKQ